MKKKPDIMQGLLGIGLAATLWAGCTVVVSESADPTTAPPSAPVISTTCGPNQYLHGGRHVWRNGQWTWVAPTCRERDATWRDGCRWTRGHWAQSGNRYVFNAGRLVCPAAAEIGPATDPPAPPEVTITCGANQFLRGGKHVWRGGQWVWDAPTCVATGANWRTGCRWIRGQWGRRGGRLVYTAGRRDCPAVAVEPPLEVVQPTWLPPESPPVTYKRLRCARNTRYYPGRWVFSNLARRYTWRGGKCVPLRRGCRWVAGYWRHFNGRAYYVRPAWNCRGKLSYVGHGGTAWTPPPVYATFPKWKRCPRGRYLDDKGRCVKAMRRCQPGFQLRHGRCFKPYVPTRCGRGWVLRTGRCVRVGAAVAPPGRCPAGMIRRAGRCVRAGKPCRPGTVRQGNR
ncbi:MAG: hypothetical protein ABI333_08860, partial [bacterium]